MRCFAYVDGSYSDGVDGLGVKKAGLYGSGIFLQLEDITEPIQMSFGGSDKDMAVSRNVAGEVRAVTLLLQFLSKNHPEYNQVDIYYDYEGIEKWVTGEWKAKKPMTQVYRDTVRKYMDTMVVNFHKVPAHKGVVYNEIADKLAAAGVRKEAERLGLHI